MMNFSSLSIRNPVPAILLFAWLTILGLFAFRGLGIQAYPTVDLPIIMISATQEGMAPAQLEQEVARKIENAVAPLSLLRHMRTVVVDGAVSLIVEFMIDKDVEVALSEVRNAVDSIRPELPPDMTSPPVVSKLTTAGQPLLGYTVEAANMDVADLSWFVDNELARAMLAVPGVGKFQRVGGIDREVRIDLDPVRMTALGVSASEISMQLKRVQLNSSGGRAEVGDSVQSFRTLSTARSVAEIADLTLPLADGRTVRLSDIARVHDGYADRSSIALFDGQPSVAFELTRSKGSMEVTVAEAVAKALDKFRAEHPEVSITEIYNTWEPTYNNYRGSMDLLLEGAFIAVIVVWWFLRDWRATFVATTALPLSIIPTFFGMQLLGYSLDTMTMLAISLIVGVLVDDAIVEIENITRHLRMGKSPYHAAMEAAEEIGLAVIATSFTIAAVFLPAAFIGGIPGKYFAPFGITATIAVLVSLLVARLLTPMMAAYILRPPRHEHREPPLMDRYLELARWCLNHRKITVAVAFIFLIVSLGLTTLLPTGFLPTEDRALITLVIELPPGSTLKDTEDTAREASRRLRKIPEITGVFANVGAATDPYPETPTGAANIDNRKGTLIIRLKPRTERDARQGEVENQVRAVLRDMPAVRFQILSGAPGTVLRVVLGSDDPEALTMAARNVENELRGLQGIGYISSTASLQKPEIHITPDFARAADLGVSTDALAHAVRIATAGDYKVQLAKLDLPQRQVPIRVQIDPAVRHNLDQIRQIPVAAKGGTLPLEAVAKIEMGSGPAKIDRLDRIRNLSIETELGDRVLGDLLAEANALPSLQQLPPGVVRISDGDVEYMEELFERVGVGMLVGLISVYIVLVLLFRDFLQPVTILTALPLSLGGAFVALLLTNNALSMPSIYGILMLMGIVTKNSILLVDYVIIARQDQEMSRLDALLDACHKRARPIVMTTIAMGGGMMPVALGFGAADPGFRSPMAIVVIGGLLTSTLLSLLVVPVVFTYIDDLMVWLRRLAGRAIAEATSAK
ncbi:Acriflavin resistance protein [Sterolibacterium denitrificans]|uniref:Acriflavin resistance protein n=1 Tax=Sterolibacterium denitrificans TaxID=157592 RepID=A0A7Z7HNB8_9PROT|nr:Acriflavin resistance protein [Sterolibacterium denitrificans]